MSIRVSTAVALQQGSAWPHDFTAWDDPEVQRLRNLIDVQIDDAIEADYPQLNGCRLSITLEDGEVREAYLPNMKGEPEFRMNQDEMRQKFAVLTRDLFSDERVEQIYQLCMRLESISDMGQLMRIFTAEEAVAV